MSNETHPTPARPQAPPTDLSRVGGLSGVRRIITHLVDHMVEDVMIGFFFQRVNRRHLVARETAFAASHLGGPAYRGRDVPELHRPLPIARGHFLRRLQLLRHAMAWAEVPEDVQKRWLDHQMALAPNIIAETTACPPDMPGLKVAAKARVR